MAILAILAGATGFFLCVALPSRMDQLCVRGWNELRARIQLMLRPATITEPDLLICSRLLASVRAGIGLESALVLLLKEEGIAGAVREKLRLLLDGKPQTDFLSTYLSAALHSGMPVIQTLQLFQQTLTSRRRLQLRSVALTGQARAQAEVLSWLPWAMALLIFLMDQEWFLLAAKRPLSWFLWAIALSLTGLGRKWLQRSLRKAMEPATPAEAMEENELPELLLRMVAEIAIGSDADTALDRSLAAIGRPEFRRAFQSRAPGGAKLAQLKATLSHAALTGAPLREDLLAFLQGLYQEIESRWEERVQRLPVALLLPLFVCFFPGTLLVLGGLLFPLLESLQ